MTFAFEGGVAAITGAGGGIGLAMARRFAAAGMKLALADIDGSALERSSDDLRAGGAAVEATVVDVADAVSVETFANATFRRFGAVDLLCNNAGVVPPRFDRPVWEYEIEDWHWSNNVNLMGVVHGIRSFVPRMIMQGTPAHVMNTVSLAGLIGGSSAPVYSTAKQAAAYLTAALYADLQSRGYPIGVTALCPGHVRTEIFHSERNRPGGARDSDGNSPPYQFSEDALDAADVAELAFDAVREGRLYMLTTDRYDGEIRARFEHILNRTNPII